MITDVVVIGGGPAGLLCSSVIAERGKKVILIDKNKLLGRKLRITGKGRCNITNSADISEFINMVCSNNNFMYSAFYTFTNDDVINMFNTLGVKTKEERGGRIFPQSDSAKDVADALVNNARKKGVIFKTSTVLEVLHKDSKSFVIKTKDYEDICCKSVVIATGGVSYPLTGSTGDGYKFAKKLGHTIIPPKPSLVPLVVKEKYITDLQGLSLKNISVKIKNYNKLVYDDFGELLFTHFGLSGPVILSASSNMNFTDNSKYICSIDLKPALTLEQLDKRIQRDFEKYINKDFSNSLDDLLPKKLIDVIVMLSGISPNTKVNQISKEQRINLCNLLKNFSFEIIGTRPIDEAIITRGGINVKEINPSTMESKLINGLYFCGEVVDVDAYTGGFNLQIAFSTGYLAGLNA